MTDIFAADVRKIHEAYYEEASRARLGLRPVAQTAIQEALVPHGGDWQCTAREGAITRLIEWNGREVALVNPRGDLDDRTEGQIAMGLCATPALDKALRVIYVLASDPDNSDLIGRIARAAVCYIERDPPVIREPADDEYPDEIEDDGE